MNTKINYNDIELVPASLANYPAIQNMARFYAYDMSELLIKKVVMKTSSLTWHNFVFSENFKEKVLASL